MYSQDQHTGKGFICTAHGQKELVAPIGKPHSAHYALIKAQYIHSSVEKLCFHCFIQSFTWAPANGGVVQQQSLKVYVRYRSI